MMKICETTGSLYFAFDSVLWLLNLNLAAGASVETLPLELLCVSNTRPSKELN